MLAYLALVTILILGMDLGGIRCPTMNSAAFINIFFRFLEILVVYSYVEQENMCRKVRIAKLGIAGTINSGNRSSFGVSTMTICTLAENAAANTTQGNINEEQSPPPSYSANLPNTGPMEHVTREEET